MRKINKTHYIDFLWNLKKIHFGFHIAKQPRYKIFANKIIADNYNPLCFRTFPNKNF